MSEPVPYHEAIRQARGYSEMVLREMHKRQEASPFKVGDELTIVDGDGRTWQMEVEDTMPYEGGARIMGKAQLLPSTEGGASEVGEHE